MPRPIADDTDAILEKIREMKKSGDYRAACLICGDLGWVNPKTGAEVCPSCKNPMERPKP